MFDIGSLLGAKKPLTVTFKNTRTVHVNLFTACFTHFAATVHLNQRVLLIWFLNIMLTSNLSSLFSLYDPTPGSEISSWRRLHPHWRFEFWDDMRSAELMREPGTESGMWGKRAEG